MNDCNEVIPARQSKLINTGLKTKIPKGYYGRVAPTSGNAVKGISVDAGVIDRGYDGFLKVLLINRTDKDVTIGPSAKIA